MKYFTCRKASSELEKKYNDTFAETCKRAMSGSLTVLGYHTFVTFALAAFYAAAGILFAYPHLSPIAPQTLREALPLMDFSVNGGFAIFCGGMTLSPLSVAFRLARYGSGPSEKIMGEDSLTRKEVEKILESYLRDDEERPSNPYVFKLIRKCPADFSKRFPLVINRFLARAYDKEKGVFTDDGEVFLQSIILSDIPGTHREGITSDYIEGWFNTFAEKPSEIREKTGDKREYMTALGKIGHVFNIIQKSMPDQLAQVNVESIGKSVDRLLEKMIGDIQARAKIEPMKEVSKITEKARAVDGVQKLVQKMKAFYDKLNDKDKIQFFEDKADFLQKKRISLAQELAKKIPSARDAVPAFAFGQWTN